MLTEVLTGPATFKSLPLLNLETCSKNDIRDHFLNSYSLNESIFLGLKDESVFYVRPERLRLPLIFYYGHTACVYMNKLVLAGLIKPEDRVNHHFETLFETGVDEMSWDDTENYRMGGKFQWPRLSEVVDYRRKVKAAILKVIDDTPLDLPITKESPWWAVLMGVDHERIHLETSSVLIRQLPVHLVTVPEGWQYGPATHDEGVQSNDLITVAETTVTLGKPEDDPYYGWGNEYGRKTLRVPRFEASRYLVTNLEFLDFMDDQGYERRELWTEEGWQWKSFTEVQHPTFWVCTKGCKSGCGADLENYSHCKPMAHLTNGQNGHCNGHNVTDGNGHQGYDEGGGDNFRYRGVFSEFEMPWDWPVDVNYHEAKAFCHWKGDHFRLATEAEHAAMRDAPVRDTSGRARTLIPDNCDERGTAISANHNMLYGSSTPVNMFPPSSRGFHDLLGNVWEWLEDHFNGFPNGGTHYLYDDFSSPGFDGRHNMILGGSWVSTANEMDERSRYAFRRHFFQHAGFRFVRSVPDDEQERIYVPAKLVSTPLYVQGVGSQEAPAPPMDPAQYTFEYEPSTNKQMARETPEALDVALAEQFGNDQGFQDLLANSCKAAIEKFGISRTKATHLGCGTGHLATRIASYFSKTFATDAVGRIIDTCMTLARGNEVTFTEDGVLKLARFDDDAGCRNLTFKQLTWLPQEVESSNFILVTDLHHYNNEKAWLARMPELLLPGGILAIVCSDTWGPPDLVELYKGRFGKVHQEDLFYPDGSADLRATLVFFRPE